jgi:uncharacterized protein (TIGR02147 family)
MQKRFSMGAVSLFEFSDYKKYLIAWIEQAPNSGRGLRKTLADAIGCQTPFITHVLSGDYDFSLEQAEACGRWMNLAEEEIEFLLLLVMKKRAATKPLEKLISKQIAGKREKHSKLKTRLQIQESLSREDQLIYYSNWIYQLVHMAVMMPACQTVEGLCTTLRQPPPTILSAIDFLQSRGLIAKTGKAFKVVRPMLHLEVDSPLLKQHLTNWRLKALDKPMGTSSEDLHYTGVMSLSQDDYEWLRERLSGLLEEAVQRLKDSKDEKLACLNFDWFTLA